MLKELYKKNKDRGLAIIGVSLDDDAKALQAAAESRGITWPLIRDGKDGQIAKLFNAKATPTYYLLDRSGRIAAKNPAGDRLAAAISALLQK